METKEDLINLLIADGYLKSPLLIEAFKEIDRKDFLPEEIKERAYENSALAIGNKQTISQPLVVVFMQELLELKNGEKVLEIGTGSGWQTALMAKLVGESGLPGQGKIISIERITGLNEFAKMNLLKYGFLEKGTIELILGDGSYGYGAGAPYDKIIAAASGEEIPEAWKEQLKIGGRIVAPVKNSIVVLDKTAADKFEKKEYFGFSFVPLIVD